MIGGEDHECLATEQLDLSPACGLHCRGGEFVHSAAKSDDDVGR